MFRSPEGEANLKWFKHDSNANVDAKLKKLRAKYGLQGYGLYWLILEYIAMNVEKHNLTFELEHDAETLAADTGLHIDVVQEMMTYMVERGLFENASGVITCLKMATRTDEYTQKLIKKGGIVGTLSGQNPRKSELIEENRIEEKRIDKFVSPSLEEVTSYIREKGYAIDPEYFINYQNARDWVLSNGKKMKCWKSTLAYWESKNRKQESNDRDEYTI